MPPVLLELTWTHETNCTMLNLVWLFNCPLCAGINCDSWPKKLFTLRRKTVHFAPDFCLSFQPRFGCTVCAGFLPFFTPFLTVHFAPDFTVHFAPFFAQSQLNPIASSSIRRVHQQVGLFQSQLNPIARAYEAHFRGQQVLFQSQLNPIASLLHLHGARVRTLFQSQLNPIARLVRLVLTES